MNKISLFLCTILLASNILYAQKKKSVLLQYNYKVGKHYQFDMGFEQNMLLPNSPQEVQQNMFIGADFEVLSVEPNGDALLRMTYNRIKIDMASISYDTDNADETDDSPVAQSFNKLKGKWVNLRLSKNGKLIEVTEGDEALKEAIKNENSAFTQFPDKPIKIGKGWKTEQKRDVMGISIKLLNTYTLKDYQDGKWILLIESIILDKDNKKVGSQKMDYILEEQDIMCASTAGVQNFDNLIINGNTLKMKSNIKMKIYAK